MKQTPYEAKLHLALAKARAAHDDRCAAVLEKMIRVVRQGSYGRTQALFPFLRPVYYRELGVPPVSRKDDV